MGFYQPNNRLKVVLVAGVQRVRAERLFLCGDLVVTVMTARPRVAGLLTRIRPTREIGFGSLSYRRTASKRSASVKARQSHD